MKKDSSNEFAMAFAVGALLGVGAALLLAPDPPTRREKLMKELKPYRKKLRRKVAAATGNSRSAAAEMGDELMEAGRTVARDLREEVTELVANARSEIAATVEEQLEAAQDALRKGAKRMRN